MKSSPNYGIGTSIREKYYLKDKYKYEIPPPNVYNPSISFVKKNSPATGFGYGDRSYLNRTFTAPGPGSYQAPTKIGEGPKFHMGVKLEDQSIAKKAALIPSPVAYNPKVEYAKEKMAVFSIGKSLRPSVARSSKVPGPGSYYDPTVLTSFKESPQYGFGSSSRPEIVGGTKK